MLALRFQGREPLAKGSSGIPTHDCEVSYILGHHAAGRDDRTLTYPNAAQNYAGGTNPNVPPDFNAVSRSSVPLRCSSGERHRHANFIRCMVITANDLNTH